MGEWEKITATTQRSQSIEYASDISDKWQVTGGK